MTWEADVKNANRLSVGVDLYYVDPDTGTTGVKSVGLTRFTDDSKDYSARLLSVGGFERGLSADSFFSGIAERVTTSIAVDASPTTARGEPTFWDWQDLSFAGQKAVIKVGTPGAMEPILTAAIEDEPVLTVNQQQGSPAQVVFQIAEAPAGLRKRFATRRYVGVPGAIQALTNTATITVADHADFNITRYTIILRVKWATNPVTTPALLTRRVLTAANWIIRTETSGAFRFFVRNSAGMSIVDITSAGTYNDGDWHTLICACDDSREAYMSIDGVVESTVTPSGTPNTPTASVEFLNPNGSGWTGEMTDLRFEGTYLTHDRAWALAQVFDAQDREETVSVWDMSDASGGTVTDVVSAHNGTHAGVENTDYAWTRSDLGDEVLGGQPMPVSYGLIAHAPADLHDSVNFRFRVNDRTYDPLTSTGWELYSRGVKLTTGITDVGDGVFSSSTAQDEPVTFKYIDTTAALDADTTLGGVVEDIFQDRAAMVSDTDYSADYILRAIQSLPVDVGYFTRDGNVIVEEVLDLILRPVGAHLSRDRSGLLRIGYLWPPLLPGPYGMNDPVLELLGLRGSNSGIDCGNRSGPLTSTSDYSVTAWIKPRALFTDSDGFTICSKQGTFDFQFRHDPADTIGLQLDVPGFTFTATAASTVKVSFGKLDIDSWLLCGFAVDGIGKTCEIMIIEKNSATVFSETFAFTGTFTGTANSFLIGNAASLATPEFCGGIAHVATWNATRTTSELKTISTTKPTTSDSGLNSLYPLTEGSGTTATEAKGGSTHTIVGGKWTPTLTLDLYKQKGASFEVRRAVTIKEIALRYARNYSPLQPADIAGSVGDSDIITLRRPWKEYGQPRSVETEQETRLPDETQLNHLAEVVSVANSQAVRWGPGGFIGKIGGVDRRALILDPGDEIRVIGPGTDDAGWIVPRISVGDLDSNILSLWRT